MAQNPVVTIEMENGDIMKAELYPEIAPNTVNNFISLWCYFPQSYQWLYVTRWGSRWNRYGWPRILYQRRIH